MWVIPNGITDFDYSWTPPKTKKAYVYQFGTQWQDTGGPYYAVEGANKVKYINHPTATRLPSMEHWEVPSNIDATNFDFSWHPDSRARLYIYEFGTQWQPTGGPRYVVPGATRRKLMEMAGAKNIPTLENWEIVHQIIDDGFDFSWHPDSRADPFIYAFGNQWYSAEVLTSVLYVVEGATEVKFMDCQKAIIAPTLENWIIPEGFDLESFDFSWQPNPFDELFIYEFESGPIYATPAAHERKYIKDDPCY
jgi:hypothetical protein